MSNESTISKPSYDIFQREAIARSMCELICRSSSEALSPVSLQGPWGSGKSVHAHRIKRIIEEQYSNTHKCIYWNAANCDYATEPLPLFVRALYLETEEKHKKDFSKAGLELCRATAIALAKEAVSIFAKAKWNVNLREAWHRIRHAQDKTKSNELIQFELFLNKANEDSSRILAAKKILELAGGNKELIIIIDELDRCRPDFALKMLESIKHFFSHDKCKFMLIMNDKSMIHSVQHLYGLSDAESSVYLNKYIKSHLQLPPVTGTSNYPRDCNILYFLRLIDIPNLPSNGPAYKTAEHLLKFADLQLREIEKWVNTFNLLFSISNKKDAKDAHHYHCIILLIISFLMAIKPEIINKLSNQHISVDSLLLSIGIEKGKQIGDSFLDYDTGFLRGCFTFFLRGDLTQAAEECTQLGINSNLFHQLSICASLVNEWLQHATFLKS